MKWFKISLSHIFLFPNSVVFDILLHSQAPVYKSQVILDDKLPTIMVNEPLFCTAIDNLIRNGLKYNDSLTKVVKVWIFFIGYLTDIIGVLVTL